MLAVRPKLTLRGYHLKSSITREHGSCIVDPYNERKDW